MPFCEYLALARQRVACRSAPMSRGSRGSILPQIFALADVHCGVDSLQRLSPMIKGAYISLASDPRAIYLCSILAQPCMSLGFGYA